MQHTQHGQDVVLVLVQTLEKEGVVYARDYLKSTLCRTEMPQHRLIVKPTNSRVEGYFCVTLDQFQERVGDLVVFNAVE